MLTVADNVKLASVSGLVSLTVGVPTSRSGDPCICVSVNSTVICTAIEQLLVVSDSPATVSTHTP